MRHIISGSKYKEATVKEGVLVKVPKESLYMEEVGAHTMDVQGKMIRIKHHYRNGLLIPGAKVVVSRHFYGIKEYDLGKKIVATVRVIEKTTFQGRKFTILDIVKAPDKTKAICEIKFTDNGQENGVPILGTNYKILFKEK